MDACPVTLQAGAWLNVPWSRLAPSFSGTAASASLAFNWSLSVEREAALSGRVVVETNQGGDLVPLVLRQFAPNLPVRTVHATRGKVTRAEPVSTAYERGKVHHVGTFPVLEEQMTAFTPDIDRATQGSPDRVDALVWAITDLLRRPPQRATSRRLGR